MRRRSASPAISVTEKTTSVAPAVAVTAYLGLDGLLVADHGQVGGPPGAGELDDPCVGRELFVEGEVLGGLGPYRVDVVGDHTGHQGHDPGRGAARGLGRGGQGGHDVVRQGSRSRQIGQDPVGQLTADPQRLWPHRGDEQGTPLSAPGTRAGMGVVAVISSPWKSAVPVSVNCRRAVRNSRSRAMGRSKGRPKPVSVSSFVPRASPR